MATHDHGSLLKAILTALSNSKLDILSSSEGGLNNDDSVAAEASSVIKAGAGKLYEITGYSNKGADQWIQVFNTASLPADGTIPVISFIARANSNFYWSAGRYGKKFSTGMVICNSSTLATKTIGSADCWFNVQYI